MDEGTFPAHFDAVSRPRIWHIGHAQINARGLRPQPRLAKVADCISFWQNHSQQQRLAAIGGAEPISADILIGKSAPTAAAKADITFRLALRSTCGRA